MELVKCTHDALFIAGKEFPHAGRKSSITISAMPGSGVEILLDRLVSQACIERESVAVIASPRCLDDALPKIIAGLNVIDSPSWIIVKSGAFLDLLADERYKQLDEKTRIVQCTQESGIGEDVVFKGVKIPSPGLKFLKHSRELILAVRDTNGMNEVIVPLG